jgi:AraC-like DNA-binding protein
VPGKEFELTKGKCIYVKKGAHIIEQFFDTVFCLVVFFVSDKFILETLRNNPLVSPKKEGAINNSPIFSIHTDDSLQAFFNSVAPYFSDSHIASNALLELKFKELILNVSSNPANIELNNYFYSLLTDTNAESIRKIMEENFYYNLRIEEFARLCGKSLSAFKRDFEESFKTTHGRWLLDRRLKHAQLLISTSNKTVSEAAFESGFENVSHFSRAFKQHFGSSPLHYRRSGPFQQYN